LTYEPVHSGTHIGGALQALTNLIKKRCICFVLSDFMNTNYEEPLKIAARKYDLIGVHVYDKQEQIIPAQMGITLVYNPETKVQRWEDFGSKKIRDQYKLQYDNYYNYLPL